MCRRERHSCPAPRSLPLRGARPCHSGKPSSLASEPSEPVGSEPVTTAAPCVVPVGGAQPCWTDPCPGPRAPLTELRPHWGSAAGPAAPGPVARTWQGAQSRPSPREQAPQPTSGHPSQHTDLPAPPLQATRSGPAAACFPMPTCCPESQGLPLHHSLCGLYPENVSQKHQDTRPSRQPSPQPLPSTAQKRRATGSFSLGLQPWSSGEPQRQTAPAAR